ncbi:GSCFA domain-containing protein [Jannaschia sp. Os4]|uniref:GSCFA domain-containing protein n=1 Tax=Jannaschia sp. Os4 TaxID=2807617 RepID=UPI001939B8F2|nr:GSCFA domain-containing protein [Jannaschia sp. Os4]MBM2577565.1 GSCFA domain-containing protein [Jannaschia sp. Os4]
MKHPYEGLPDTRYWRRSVGDRHYAALDDLWEPISLSRGDTIATAGSCFAQHIGDALRRNGARWLDAEPAPVRFPSLAEARRWGYGVYSCRYGNVYTVRQLLQLFEEAFGRRVPEERVWKLGDRWVDALRPTIDPVGHDSPDDVLAMREAHLAAVRRMFESANLFVFTLGLTETWASARDGTVYPVAPGVSGGRYDPDRYAFLNMGYIDVRRDLLAFWGGLQEVNPGARMLLTVSPVSLAATASPEHVLLANTYSKSVLRAVAGDVTRGRSRIAYFPSYEMIATHPSRATFYEPNLREVNPFGVETVMRYFLRSVGLSDGGAASTRATDGADGEGFEILCDEEMLDER